MPISNYKLFFTLSVGGIMLWGILSWASPVMATNCCCTTDYAECYQIDAGTCPPAHPTAATVPNDLPCSMAQRQTGGVVNQPSQPTAGGKSWVSAVVCPGQPDKDCEIIPKQCRAEVKDPETGEVKKCTLNDLLSILVRLSKLMLGVLGTAAFAMFIYGGFVFLLSQGNQERVSKGKSILLNAVIGILVVFISWTLINFVVNAFSVGRGGLGQTGSVFDKPWNQGP